MSVRQRILNRLLPVFYLLDLSLRALSFGSDSRTGARILRCPQFVDSIFKTQMAGCRGTALAPGSGALYVAVKDGHAIWKVDSATGKASVLTGGNGIGFRDGMPAEARFAFPSGLAVSADGDAMYVADFLNDRIRKVTLREVELEQEANDGAKDDGTTPHGERMEGSLWGSSSSWPPGPPPRRKGVVEGLMGARGQGDFMGLARTSRKAQQLCQLGVTGCARVSTVAGSSRGFSDGLATQVRGSAREQRERGRGRDNSAHLSIACFER